MWQLTCPKKQHLLHMLGFYRIRLNYLVFKTKLSTFKGVILNSMKGHQHGQSCIKILSYLCSSNCLFNNKNLNGSLLWQENAVSCSLAKMNLEQKSEFILHSLVISMLWWLRRRLHTLNLCCLNTLETALKYLSMPSTFAFQLYMLKGRETEIVNHMHCTPSNLVMQTRLYCVSELCSWI